MSGRALPTAPDFRRFYRPVVFLGLAAFGAALALFAYTGTFTRYWADDYCYNAVLRSDGFWLAQLNFYRHTSDRYSVIPLVGISEVFGPAAIRFWPAAALFVSPSNALRLVHMPEPAGLPTLVSLLTPFALGLAWHVRAGCAPRHLPADGSRLRAQRVRRSCLSRATRAGRRRAGLGALLLFAAAALYPLRAAGNMLAQDLPDYQARAARWDARDQQARAMMAQGEKSLRVPALDSIGGLMELTTDPNCFPNTCFAGAYGALEVTGFIP